MTYTCFDGLVFFLIGSKVRVGMEDIWAEKETVAALDTEHYLCVLCTRRTAQSAEHKHCWCVPLTQHVLSIKVITEGEKVCDLVLLLHQVQLRDHWGVFLRKRSTKLWGMSGGVLSLRWKEEGEGRGGRRREGREEKGGEGGEGRGGGGEEGEGGGRERRRGEGGGGGGGRERRGRGRREEKGVGMKGMMEGKAN